MTLVPFGLQPDGRLIDAGMAKRGKACNCVCPGCKMPLVARKGHVRVKHFGHEADTECRHGAETALHMAAKQLVAELHWINLPQLSVTVCRNDPEYGRFEAVANYHDIKQWRFQSAQAEVALESIRPDVIGLGEGGEKYAVEIYVTHKVDEIKANYIHSIQLPCIEINLQDLIGKLISFEDLAAHLQRNLSSKLWIYHPHRREYEAALMLGFEPWRTRQAKVFNAAAVKEQRLLEREQRKHDEIQRKLEEDQRKRDLLELRYHTFRQSPLTEKWRLLHNALGVTKQNWPKHLAVTVREGADAFMVTKEMWQGALFSRYIYKRGSGALVGKKLPDAPVLRTWIAHWYGVHEGAGADARVAIQLYLGYLTACGFLTKNSEGYVVSHGGLLPPVAQSRPTNVAAADEAHSVPTHFKKGHHRMLWSVVWADGNRLRKWAGEYAESHMQSGFRPDDFVFALLHCAIEPSREITVGLLETAGGNELNLHGLLTRMGVTQNTWRYVSSGAPPPWSGAMPAGAA